MSIASLYPSINPSLLLDFANSKALDPRITFVRTTTATYYDGVTTAKAEENLLLYSQQFDNAYWVPSNTTVTADTTTAPDGTSTADKLSMTTQTNYFSLGVGSSSQFSYVGGQTYTLSVYMKSAPNQFGFIGYYDNAFRTATFDLTNGTANASSGVGSVSITSVGNGWYRCVFTFTPVVTAGSFAYFGVANGSSYQFPGTFAGTAGNGIFIWGAQLEQRSSATAYTATTTQAITNYIPVLQTASSGVARFDHNPTTGESLGLLIEEARTNLATYSEQFNNAAWAQSYLTENITINSAVSPNGQVTADTISDSAATAEFAVGQTVTGVSANVPYTFSVFAKANNSNFLYLRYYGNVEQFYYTVIFDLSLGTATKSQIGSSASNNSNTITSVGNGWYRLTVTATVNQTTLVPMIGIAASGTDTIGSFGNISVNGTGYRSCFIWGAQVEAGSFATSYIPTTGLTATRNADAASMTGTNFSSWFNNGEGTLYAEGIVSWGTNAYPRLVNINNGSLTQKIDILANSATSLYGAVTYNGSDVFGQAVTTTLSSSNKTAIAYAYNNGAFLVNSSSPTTDTSMNVPSVSQINIGATNSGFYANGAIKKISYYPIRVTNAQLQALTV